MTRWAAALALALAAGCTTAEETPEPTPCAIRVVAVLPFADLTGRSGFDPDQCADLLACQLARFGFRVVRPAQLRQGAPPGETVTTAADAVRVGRRAAADAVLACAITDYDPYDPPRVAVLAQFLSVASPRRSTFDLDRLLRSGSWNRGPLSLSRDQADHALAAFEEVYDVRDRETRQALQSYAQRRAVGDSAFPDQREFLAVQPRFLEFVSFQILRKTLELACSRGT